ncbi:MAG: hypothetical protein ABI882_13395 [Acidobacteriota bacterium]
MAVRLFVGNLPYDATEAELRELFSSVGQLSYLSLPMDRETGRPRGFAFVEFNDAAQAAEAVRQFNNQLFKGRPLAVNEARAREDRPAGGFQPRPLSIRPNPMSEPGAPSGIAPPEGRSNRSFGADAAPFRSRSKGKGGPKGGERAPKGPMRTLVRGQFFGADEDDDIDDDILDDDLNGDGDDLDTRDDLDTGDDLDHGDDPDGRHDDLETDEKP